MGMSNDYIGYTLQRLLDERGMRLADLSSICGVTRANVTVYTSGRKRMPRFEQAKAFCDALGISLDRLWWECESDWKRDSYRRWLQVCDLRYGRGAYAAREDRGDAASPEEYPVEAGGRRMVAGEGVEPPTQGFSVFRRLLKAS